jgi:hypothetical protein
MRIDAANAVVHFGFTVHESGNEITILYQHPGRVAVSGALPGKHRS